MRRWISDFQSGNRKSFDDDPRSGRPTTTSACGDSVALVKDAFGYDPQASVREIALIINLPKSVVHEILTKQLNYHKIASYWVPMVLNDQQKANRVMAATNIKQKLLQLGNSRYDVYAVEDETWVRYDIETTSTRSKVWLPKSAPRPQVVSNKLTPRKCLALIAFTPNKPISVKTLPYGETVTGELFVEFMRATGEK